MSSFNADITAVEKNLVRTSDAVLETTDGQYRIIEQADGFFRIVRVIKGNEVFVGRDAETLNLAKWCVARLVKAAN